ncbi:MAG: M15 family metallopeptidase [Tenericutes bacterium]|nr:M15 family metallopeptidase [Mycoplasmatota bacterium]MDD6941753.1 M15 family metallopeptidase [bacterium]MDY2697382.1 M15 family metallopeptidase [Bacilli bacterium]
MAKKRKLKLKKPFVIILKIIFIVILVFLGMFLFYSYQVKDVSKLGYDKEASKNILLLGKKDAIKSYEYSDTLNAAFKSKYYKDANLDSYSKIKYQDQKNIIKNINTLIDKGYSNSNISLILAHGNDDDVSEFAKRDKIKYLEEFYSLSYAKLKYYDRYVKYSSETGEDEETTVLFVNLSMDTDDYVNPVKTSAFSIDMLVNKHYKLDEDFVPDDLVEFDQEYCNDEVQEGNREAVVAFKNMYEAAKKEGLGLVINSSYRSYQDQENICNTFKDLYGEGYVTKYVALPGFSEHQTGLAFDIGSTSSKIFAESKEYEWMKENAYKYGFILRFTKANAYITGFRSEPWHYRYVGKKVAKYIYDNNISLEEYYAEFLDN